MAVTSNRLKELKSRWKHAPQQERLEFLAFAFDVKNKAFFDLEVVGLMVEQRNLVMVLQYGGDAAPPDLEHFNAKLDCLLGRDEVAS